MSLFGSGILGSLGGLFGYNDPSGMANAAYNQQQQYGSSQAYNDMLRNYQIKQYSKQSAPKKPTDSVNIIDAEFTVIEIDGIKLIGESND